MKHVKGKGAFFSFFPELRMVFYFSPSLQRLLIPQRCLILFFFIPLFLFYAAPVCLCNEELQKPNADPCAPVHVPVF